jgi:hypothetical protein
LIGSTPVPLQAGHFTSTVFGFRFIAFETNGAINKTRCDRAVGFAPSTSEFAD